MEAWYTTALEIEESLSGAVDYHHHFSLLICLNLLTLLIGYLYGYSVVLGCPPGSGVHILSTMLMFGYVLSLLLVWVSLGPGMEAFHKDCF